MLEIGPISFLTPWWLLLIPILLLVVWYFLHFSKQSSLYFPATADIVSVFRISSWSHYLHMILLSLIIIFMGIILASPHSSKKEGIDIVLALDLSLSMKTEDFSPNRLEAAKNITAEFIKAQESNRVGLVLFAGRPFTSIPLTFDYELLKEQLKQVSLDMIPPNLQGTAVGDALLLSEKLFDETDENREKVIILLTDGDTNAGIEPKIAAAGLKDQKVKVYAIGIGGDTPQKVVMGQGFFQQVQIIKPLQEQYLKEIVEITEGKYYRATDNFSLQEIFDTLAKLHTTERVVDAKKNYTEWYKPWVVLLIFSFFFFTIKVVSRE